MGDHVSPKSLSILIPCRNAAGTLGLLLDSIREASDGDLETLVVDDDSTDDSPGIAARRGARVIRLRERRGPAFCRNLGARESSGAVLFFLDADVILYPDTIRRLRESLRKHPEARAVVGAYSGEPANHGWVPRYRALLSCAYHAGREAETIDAFLTAMGAVYREPFFELGGFDESYRKPGMEDLEFGHRFSRKYPIVLDPGIRVRHRFPGFLHNTRNYFSRAFAWTGLFLERGSFERYQTTASMGFGKAAGSLGVVLLAASLHWPWALCACVPAFLYYFFAHRAFYRIVRRQPGPAGGAVMLLLDLYYSTVVTLGAAAGFLWNARPAGWRRARAGITSQGKG